ncbi:hypothetical protein BJ742DRAFT_775644 [Cladochytrium replicatum]|nr:hypothetical protein BJ742DRAFT_775644 [Cladochytrium replicatum]
MARLLLLLVVWCAALVVANPIPPPQDSFTRELLNLASHQADSFLQFATTPPVDGVTCTVDFDCNHGHCATYNQTTSYCVCDKNWKTYDASPCSYEQTNKLTAFLVSLFLGELGIDWFVLSRGNGWYIAAGVLKLLTGGGAGLWWVIDWVRILTDSFADGNGVPIGDW